MRTIQSIIELVGWIERLIVIGDKEMKVKDVIKATKIEGSAVDICINQVLNFRLYAYDDGKIAWMKLPQDIEKKNIKFEC